MTGTPWSPEWDDFLRECLVDNDMSCRQAAAAFGRKFGVDMTRNATVGRAHRLGIKSTLKTRFEPHKAPRTPRAVKNTPPYPPKPKLVFACEPSSGLRVADVIPRNVPLLELQPGECHWPYGNSNYTFCGHPTFGGCSYCEQHLALSRGGGTESERRATQGIAA